MRIIYFVIDKVKDTVDLLRSPAHDAYGIGFIIGRILLFAAGAYAGYWIAVWIKVALILLGVVPME